MSSVELGGAFEDVFRSFVSEYCGSVGVASFSSAVDSGFVSVPVTSKVLGSFREVAGVCGTSGKGLGISIVSRVRCQCLDRRREKVNGGFRTAGCRTRACALRGLLVGGGSCASSFGFGEFTGLGEKGVDCCIRDRRSVRIRRGCPVDICG